MAVAWPNFLSSGRSAKDSVGTLWVADYENNRVLRFDKSVQTITFAALDTKTYGDAPFTVEV